LDLLKLYCISLCVSMVKLSAYPLSILFFNQLLTIAFSKGGPYKSYTPLAKPTCFANANKGESISELLNKYSSDISTLKETSSKFACALPENDVFYLRYCLEHDDISAAQSALESTLLWRSSSNEGKEICDAAMTAYKAATSAGGWDNDPVREAAPNAEVINEYITSNQILTTTSSKGDLVYCIRAGKIDDTSLMSRITVDQMVDFFLYCKEIQSLAANSRSLETERLVRVVTCNDLTGLKLVGGDTTFRSALSAASNKANELYPTLSGPTLLLNLPKLLGALVKIFTPLFPAPVRKKLKFERGPLDANDVKELLDLNRNEAIRKNFLSQLDTLVYKDGEW